MNPLDATTLSVTVWPLSTPVSVLAVTVWPFLLGIVAGTFLFLLYLIWQLWKEHRDERDHRNR